ncbi:MAG: site-specific DNA-methyltransferase [bacterium]
MKIVAVPMKDLRLSEYNPRKMTEKQAQDLEASIQKFGLVDPIIVNRHPDRLNVVIGGHQRVKVAMRINIDSVPVVYVELDEAQEKELNLRLNKNTGEWDTDALAKFDPDLLKLIGWSDEELGEIFDFGMGDGEGTRADNGKDPDAMPDIPASPKSSYGDLFQLGPHRLLCGDSTKSDDVTRLMQGETADMVFTDPPYNVDYVDSFGRKIKNDNLADFRGFLKQVYGTIYLTLKDNSPAYVCYAEKTVLDFRTMAGECGFDWRNTLIWLKDVPAMNFGHYTWIYEPILYLAKGSPQFYGKPNHPNLLEVPSYNSFAGRIDDQGNKVNRSLHPNQKPVPLIMTPIENSSKPGALLFEPFGGSGSTLIACEKTNRRCFVMELDPVYVDVIIARWETYTEEKAVKL